jgi:hypothetical protein
MVSTHSGTVPENYPVLLDPKTTHDATAGGLLAPRSGLMWLDVTAVSGGDSITVAVGEYLHRYPLTPLLHGLANSLRCSPWTGPTPGGQYQASRKLMATVRAAVQCCSNYATHDSPERRSVTVDAGGQWGPPFKKRWLSRITRVHGCPPRLLTSSASKPLHADC